MKTYNEYYKQSSEKVFEEIKGFEKRRGVKWWDKNTIDDEVNDLPLLENKTKVNSSEYLILHNMIIQLFLDYINEHPIDNEVYSYSIDINLLNGTWKTYLNDNESSDLNIPDSDIEYNFTSYTPIEDEEIIQSYEDLTEHVYYFFSEFIRRHREKLTSKITQIVFSIFNTHESLKSGKWEPSMDSSMSFYVNDDMIVCSM